MKEVPLQEIKEYEIDEKTNTLNKAVWLPKQYVKQNDLGPKDRVVVYLNPLDKTELIIRVKKAEVSPETETIER